MWSSVPQETAFERHRDLHDPGKIGVVKAVGVAQAFVGGHFQVLPAEGMGLPVGEVGEGHFECPAHLGLHVMDGASEAVGRQPFGHGHRRGESAVDPLRRGFQNAVKTNRSRHGESPWDERLTAGSNVPVVRKLLGGRGETLFVHRLAAQDEKNQSAIENDPKAEGAQPS
jgi:hypothetical protein